MKMYNGQIMYILGINKLINKLINGVFHCPIVHLQDIFESQAYIFLVFELYVTNNKDVLLFNFFFFVTVI